MSLDPWIWKEGSCRWLYNNVVFLFQQIHFAINIFLIYNAIFLYCKSPFVGSVLAKEFTADLCTTIGLVTVLACVQFHRKWFDKMLHQLVFNHQLKHGTHLALRTVCSVVKYVLTFLSWFVGHTGRRRDCCRQWSREWVPGMHEQGCGAWAGDWSCRGCFCSEVDLSSLPCEAPGIPSFTNFLSLQTLNKKSSELSEMAWFGSRFLYFPLVW